MTNFEEKILNSAKIISLFVHGALWWELKKNKFCETHRRQKFEHFDVQNKKLDVCGSKKSSFASFSKFWHLECYRVM